MSHACRPRRPTGLRGLSMRGPVSAVLQPADGRPCDLGGLYVRSADPCGLDNLRVRSMPLQGTHADKSSAENNPSWYRFFRLSAQKPVASSLELVGGPIAAFSVFRHLGKGDGSEPLGCGSALPNERAAPLYAHKRKNLYAAPNFFAWPSAGHAWFAPRLVNAALAAGERVGEHGEKQVSVSAAFRFCRCRWPNWVGLTLLSMPMAELGCPVGFAYRSDSEGFPL